MPASNSKMKRPAAAVEDTVTVALLKKGKFSGGATKKPATAGCLKASIGKMQAGCDDDDASGDENVDAEDCSSDRSRDKGKGEKFASMLKTNTLPAHIRHLYEEVAKSKTSPRDFRTTVINTLFERKKNGRFELRDDRPLFTEAKDLYERKYSKDRALAYPRSVMKGLYFQNNESAFLEALACGDVHEVADPTNPDSTTTYYAYRKLETGTETGTKHTSRLTKQRRANRDQSELLGDMMTGLGWKFNYKSHEKIETGKLPASMVNLLNEAIDAQTKIQGDALKFMPKLLGVTVHHLFVGGIAHVFRPDLTESIHSEIIMLSIA